MTRQPIGIVSPVIYPWSLCIVYVMLRVNEMSSFTVMWLVMFTCPRVTGKFSTGTSLILSLPTQHRCRRCHWNTGIRMMILSLLAVTWQVYFVAPFSSLNDLTLLVGRQEGHPACKNVGCSFAGGDYLTASLSPPPPSTLVPYWYRLTQVLPGQWPLTWRETKWASSFCRSLSYDFAVSALTPAALERASCVQNI